MAIDANINRIKFLRTKTAGSVPAASLLDEGELAINLVDRTIYSKNGSNVVELGFGKGGSVSSAITAPQFNGPLVGNASTATKLQTARTISLTGSATGSISFDGTSNQSISVNVNAVDTLTTYARSNDDSPTKWAQGVQSVFVSATQGWPLTYGGVITARPHSNGGGTLQILTAYGSGSTVGGGEIKIRTGDYSAAGNDSWTSWKTLVHSENVNDYSPTKTGVGASGTWGISVTGNAATATRLQTARTIGGVSFNGTANINLPGVNTTGNQSTTGSAASLTTARSFSWTGDATGSLSFNGSANVSAALTLANSGVTAGTYKSVTVDTKGRVTAGTNVVTGLVTSTAATGTTNAATTNTNTYLNIVETIGSAATTVGTSTQVTGAGTVTVTSDTAGKLTITGSQSITGNAATATRLQTARTIGGVSFNGSANINLPGVNIAGNQSTTGNAATATKLAVRNSINGTAFDGSADITIAEPTFSGYLQYYPVSDFNNISTNGFSVKYGLQTATNRPPGTDHAVITMTYSSIWSAQQAFDWRTNTSYTRCKNNGVWTAWKQLAFTDDNITGNAASATKLQTARTIGGVSFNGTANINLPGVNTAGNQSTTGNAATATRLQTARTINGVSFNGSANITIADSTKLPLAGGTMTGALRVNNTTASTSATTGAITTTGGVGIGGALFTTGAITSANNVTAYSDVRIKDNIIIIDDALNKVNKLKGVTYNRIDIDDKDKRYVGLIAQDVQSVMPEAVNINNDEINTLSVDYQGLIGLLVESIKELKLEIDELKEKVK